MVFDVVSSQEDNNRKGQLASNKTATPAKAKVVRATTENHSISPWLVSNEVVSTPASKTKEIIIRKSVITTQL